MKKKLNKKGVLIQIILSLIAIAILALFIYGMIELKKQKESGQNTFESFSDFLKDVFEKMKVKQKTDYSKESLKYLKLNYCGLKNGVKCIPYYDEGETKFKMTNNVPRINYDLKNITFKIEAKNCTEFLEGPTELKTGEARDYILHCDYARFLSGNITMNSFSKTGLPYNGKEGFFIKKS